MPIERLWFLYAIPVTAIGAGVGLTGTATLNISSDANFEWVYATAIVKQVGLIVLNWGGTMMIEDNSPSRALFNTPIPVDSLAGTGRQPYPLSPPRLLHANSTLTFTFTNNVATATQVEFVCHGNKLLQR